MTSARPEGNFPHAFSHNPDVALWRAVVSQALADAAAAPTCSTRETEIRRARIWFEGNGEDFQRVCALADLESSRVRALALKKIDEVKALAPSPNPPKRKDTQIYEFAGKALTAEQWAVELGWSYKIFRRKLLNFQAGKLTAEQVFAPKPEKQPKPKPAPREVARYEHAGKSLTMRQWAGKFHITESAMCVRLRLLKQGKISAEQAFGQKLAMGMHPNAKRYPAFGENLTIDAWAKRLGVPRSTLANRLNAGHSIEDALTMPSRRRQSETNLEASNQ